MGEVPFVAADKTSFLTMARSMGTVVRFLEGAIVFREGDPPDHMYIVLSGAIEIKSHGKIIESIKAGDSLGIVGLLDGGERTTTAYVISDTELALIDKRKFRYMVEAMPNFVWYFFNEIVHRLRTINAAL